jgi:hypothetical protein
MAAQKRLFRRWTPREDGKKKADVSMSLSADELFTGWWTEGSTPFRRSRTGTIKSIVYLSQTVDKTVMEWWSDEIMKQGYSCILREKEKGDFELEGDLASAWLFHKQIIEPRKAKLPRHKRSVHDEAMKVLPRQIGRGFGEKIRSQFK